MRTSRRAHRQVVRGRITYQFQKKIIGYVTGGGAGLDDVTGEGIPQDNIGEGQGEEIVWYMMMRVNMGMMNGGGDSIS